MYNINIMIKNYMIYNNQNFVFIKEKTYNKEFKNTALIMFISNKINMEDFILNI